MRQSGIPQTISTTRSTLLVLTTIATLLLPRAASAQAKRYLLESVERLRSHNVTVESAVLHGNRGLRATISEETLRRIERTQQYTQGLVWIEGLDISNGVIEAEIAGALTPGAGGEARGFVGIAFRVRVHLTVFEAVYRHALLREDVEQVPRKAPRLHQPLVQCLGRRG